MIQNVGINPTRDGILKVCASMGAKIEILNSHTCCGEEVADLLVRHSSLKGTVIEGALIPTLIDELPVLSVLAAFAEGKNNYYPGRPGIKGQGIQPPGHYGSSSHRHGR